MNNLLEQLEVFANNRASLQVENGAFPAGHNGPYFDKETSVRNSAHWLITYLGLYDKNKNSTYLKIINNCISYILNENNRPMGFTFHCRDKAGKDKCNGLVGQAWVIEALVKAYEVIGNNECLVVAKELYELHPQCEHTGLWHRREIDGSVLSFDPTFNHQLWFCASAALLSKHLEIAKSGVNLFINKTLNNVVTYKDGVIFHGSPMAPLVSYGKIGSGALIKEAKNRLRRKLQRKSLYSKSVGYHGFNLHAIALIGRNEEFKSMISSKVIERVSLPLFDESYIKNLKDNKFGYYYNVTGIENAFFAKVFHENPKLVDKWLSLQFEYTFESSENLLTKNTKDKNTALARTYQLVELVE